MDLKVIGFALVLLVLLSGCNDAQQSEAELEAIAELKMVGESWSLTNQELTQYGVNISEKPIVEAFGPEFGDAPTFIGYFFTIYGEDSDLAYTLYVYSDYESANNHFKEISTMFKKSVDTILDESIQQNPAILASSINETGKENLQLLYNYKNTVILMMGSSELEKNNGYAPATFLSLGKKITQKIDKNNPFLK